MQRLPPIAMLSSGQNQIDSAAYGLIPSADYGPHQFNSNQFILHPQMPGLLPVSIPKIVLKSSERQKSLQDYKDSLQLKRTHLETQIENEQNQKRQKIISQIQESIEKDLQRTVVGQQSLIGKNDITQRIKQVWDDILQDVPVMFEILQASRVSKVKVSQIVAQNCQKIVKRNFPYLVEDVSDKIVTRDLKEIQQKWKKIGRELTTIQKSSQKEEKVKSKLAEKQRQEQLKQQEEQLEKIRQAKKLQFLISQSELYSHFIGQKFQTQSASLVNKQLNRNDDFAKISDQELKEIASAQAQEAVRKQREMVLQYDESGQEPIQNLEVKQPTMINGQLKSYQLNGLKWLAQLYEQGINGILADDMGLGKTFQAISMVCWLAEFRNIWGPFLVVVPASTLHNWFNEFRHFAPDLKLLPYWGSIQDRRILRQFWSTSGTFDRGSQFHVLITSYQMVVQDYSYFQKQKWKFLILDEAHAIKSANTARWKTLLNVNCRNRLLLTGTPIQNNMQELWALLHFIMPTLFDSHEEFASWFSKDIESHAVNNKSSKLDQVQVDRLHMILKPFMLRRTKSEVEHELGEKIEKVIDCELTFSQRQMYQSLLNNVSISDLLEQSNQLEDDKENDKFMNVFMQFRKVCNHPQLFQQVDVSSPFSLSPNTINNDSNYITNSESQNLISYQIPQIVYDLLECKKISSILKVPSAISLKSTDFIGKRCQSQKSLPLLHQIKRLDKEKRIYARLQSINTSRNSSKNLFDLNWQSPLSNCHIAEESNFFQEILSIKQKLILQIRQCINVQYHPKAIAQAPAVNVSSTTFYHRSQRLVDKNGINNIISGAEPIEYFGSESYPLPVTLNGYSQIHVPNYKEVLFDSGKINAIDPLLHELKQNGHRVLIFFQMTKMMDIFEDYLTLRQFKYQRLDGSTQISERRDLVKRFQTDPEIFIFILSTRAGGLGINLTAADTVIFYDNDFNPTMDQQAMDRAHRLGQTKQVTVYRMVTKNTIEEHILKRALQKSQIQKVVMQN